MARYTIDFSTNASYILQEIAKVNAAIAKTARTGRNVEIKIDTSRLSSEIDSTFRKLDKQISTMQSKLSNLRIGSRKFQERATGIGIAEGMRERGTLQAQSIRLGAQAEAFDIGSAVRLQKQLQALRIEASQVAPNTGAWMGLQQQISKIKFELQAADKLAENIQMRENLGAFSPGSLNALEAKLIILKNRAREISPDTTEWKKLNQEIVKTEQSVAQQNKRPLTRGQRLGAAGGAFLYGGGLGGGVGSAVGGIAGGLLGGVPGAFTGAAIGQAVDNLGQYAAGIAKTVAEVNKSRIALAGVTKDAKDYETALAAATEGSKKFLIPISESTRQFTRLQASVAGAGYNTSTTTKVFNGISSAIIATGGNTESLNAALLATSQVFSKGKVTAEELRGQIGERLPGAFTIFAQAIGKTPQELDKALEKGEVTLADFVKFTDELMKRYGSTAEELARAPENAGARLKVAMEAASVTFGGFFQTVGAGFQNYISDLFIFALENEKSIKRVVTIFAIGFNTLGGLIGKFTKFLVDAFNKAFTYLLGNLDTVMARIEDAINRATAAASLSEKQIQGFQAQADKATKEKFGVRAGGYNTGIIADQAEASKFYNTYFNQLIDTATKSKGAKTYTSKIQDILFPNFVPSSFGAGLGNGQTMQGGAGTGAGGKTKRTPFSEIADLDSQLAAKNAGSEKEVRLQELITAARLAGNDAEAESLGNLSGILGLNSKIAEMEAFITMLENKRVEIIGSKSLTQTGYNNKLAKASVELEVLRNERKIAFLQLQVKENDLAKEAQKVLDEKLKKEKEYQRLLQDTRIAAGAMSPREAARLSQQRQFEDDIAKAKELGRSPEEINALMQAQAAVPLAGSLSEQINKLRGELEDMTNLEEMVKEGAKGIGEAFGNSFKQIANGLMTAQEALASFFQNVGDYFLDMAARMIAKWMEMQAIGLAQNLLSGLAGAAGGGMGIGGAVSAAGKLNPSVGFGAGTFTGFASGGIAKGGFVPFRAFAEGGMVAGPTLGLVGEGKYNEAIIPMPNGKSVPVDLRGAAPGNQIVSNITVNVSNGKAETQGGAGGGADLSRKLEGAVKQVIIGELRPGGVLAGRR